MCDTRIIVDCEDCGGSGRRIGASYWSPEGRDYGPCSYCCGSGEIEIEQLPIEQEDFPCPTGAPRAPPTR